MDIFIDRRIERRKLLSEIQQQHVKSQVILISAPSGIGKSRLVDYVVNEYGYKIPYRVNIYESELSETVDGYFFRKITRLFSNNAEKFWGLKSFPWFVQHHDLVGTTLRVGIRHIAPSIGNEISQVKNTMRDVDSWLENNDHYLNLAKEYIISILDSLSERIVLTSIENVQGIDTVSLNYIVDVVDKSKNFLLFLEFTQPKSRLSEFDVCEKFREKGIEVSPYSLDKLPKEEILKEMSINKLYELISDTYDNSDGNLFKLRILWDTSESSLQSITYQETITASLEHLTEPERIILSSIELHQGLLSYDKLAELSSAVIINPEEKKSLKDHLDYLCKVGLLKSIGFDYMLAHDSIVSEIRNSKRFKRTIAFSINLWMKYYQLQDDSLEITKEQRFNNDKQVLFLALRKKDYAVFAEKLGKIDQLLQKFPISKLVLYLDTLIKQYEQEKSDSDYDQIIYRHCLFIFYQCGQFNQVIALGEERVEFFDSVAKICYIAALSSENQTKAETLLRKWFVKKETEQIELALQLVKIRLLRAKGDIKGCRRLWEMIDRNQSYNGSILKGDICRYVSLCVMDDYDLRINKQREAYKSYENNNRTYGKTASALILARDYCFLHLIDESRMWMENARKLLETSLYPRYQYYNNAGLLQLFSDSYNSAISYFDRALETCTNSDDIILIESNKLSGYILTNNHSAYVDDLFMHLYHEYQLHNHIVSDELLYNCYNYAIQGEHHEIVSDLQKSYDCLVDKIKNSKGVYFNLSSLLQYVDSRCLPVFVIDWDIDFYNVLNNS